MAASAATASSSPGLCPNYAVICSFLERYGVLLDLPELTFPQLERYLQDTSSVPKLLVDLHVKLLRKIGKSVTADRWEKYLVKVCQEFNTTWAWELEQKGYKELPTECKTGILKYLCECQFDENVKFKTAINEEDPDKMRLQPIGRDKDGQMYWFQLDQDDNVRVYLEEQDDLDGSSWKCIVKDRNDLAEVVALLKTQIDPALLKKDQETKPDGEEGEVKKIEDSSDEDNKDSNKDVGPLSPKTENKEKVTQKENMKSETSEATSSLNGTIEGKTETELNSEKPTDCSINSKAQNIKEEPMEVSNTKTSTTTSEPSSEMSCISVKTEKREEARKNSAEEIQQALKNDQQAKIPLKKRGMKFSEDFEKHSGIIVPNPSVSQVKEAPKADSAPEQTKKAHCVNDHVNGEVQPSSEKGFQSNLCKSPKDAAVHKEQTVEPVADKSVEKRENDSPSDKDDMQDKKDEACRAEKVTEGVASNQANSGKKNIDVQLEKESTASKEMKEAHKSLPPLPKDTNNEPEKSSNHEEHEKIRGSIPAISKESCPVDKTLKETNTTFTAGESEKVTSKEVESKDSEEKPASVDTSESNPTKKSENVTDMKQAERGDAKETETSESKLDKPAAKEKPEVIKTAYPANKSADAVSPSVIKKTEILKDSDNTETQEATQTPKVIEKADKPVISEKIQGTESSVIKKLDKSCRPVEKHGNVKDAEINPEQASVASESNTEKTKKTDKPEDIKKTVNCEDDTIHSVSKISNSTPRATEVDAVVIKPDLTKPQEDDKTEINSVACMMTEEASEGKDKPSSGVKTTNVFKETDKKPERPDAEQEKLSEEQPKKLECLSPENIKDAQKENKKDTVNKNKKDTDSENKKDTDNENKKDTDNENKKDTDNENKKDTDNENKKDTDNENKKDTDNENKKDTDNENKKDTDNENKKDTDNENKKDTVKEKKKDTVKEKKKDTVKENKKDTDKENKKDTVEEKLKNDSEKPQCQDKENKEDSTTATLPKTDESNEEKHTNKESKTSTKIKESGHQKVSKEPDSKSSSETEKTCPPSKELDTKKPTEEESKSRSEDEDSATKKGVANGEEAPSELYRRKIKPRAHRRKAELQREERQADSESDTNTGRSLRRSPRISRPTPKVVEIHDRKLEKSQAATPAEKCEDNEGENKKDEEGEEEEEEEEEVKAVQKKPREKKADQEGQPKPKGRKRRKVRWSNTRTRRKKKGSEDDNDSDEESSEEDEEESEDDSDEDYKVERGRKRRNRNRERRSSDSSTSSDDDLPPNDDPCKHCGLPNHPELILLCDSCDSGYHTACLRPPLMIIPDGEWFCPPCQHVRTISLPGKSVSFMLESVLKTSSRPQWRRKKSQRSSSKRRKKQSAVRAGAEGLRGQRNPSATDLMNLMRRSRRQLRKTSKKQKAEELVGAKTWPTSQGTEGRICPSSFKRMRAKRTAAHHDPPPVSAGKNAGD
ncbi:hypothetical protein FQN60_000423 [Etheostoma spectabile]|uniref:PHD-type domain-containing protein n=1 Tax=Etheostoma spectabile TaxID=54343 RepID=A0A5J5CY56_9PERO|nr:hypothetical protein FQN60_000423 [Etheostoma spectabile]